MAQVIRLISSADVEGTEIVGLQFEGVEPKPERRFYLDASLDPTTHLLNVKVVISAPHEDGFREHILDFEDTFPIEALLRRGTVGIDLRDFLDPFDEPERVVASALSNLLVEDAELWVMRDESVLSKERVVTFRLRIGAAYEDEVECKLDDLVGFLEPAETELDPKLREAMEQALGPLPEKS